MYPAHSIILLSLLFPLAQIARLITVLEPRTMASLSAYLEPCVGSPPELTQSLAPLHKLAVHIFSLLIIIIIIENV